MSVDRVEQFVVHRAGILRTLRHRVCGAMMQVIAEERPSDTPQSFLYRGNLSNDVRTVAIFFDHLVKTADLTFYSTKPFQVGSLNGRIDCNRLASALIAGIAHG